jgi:hypothetical protein
MTHSRDPVPSDRLTAGLSADRIDPTPRPLCNAPSSPSSSRMRSQPPLAPPPTPGRVAPAADRLPDRLDRRTAHDPKRARANGCYQASLSHLLPRQRLGASVESRIAITLRHQIRQDRSSASALRTDHVPCRGKWTRRTPGARERAMDRSSVVYSTVYLNPYQGSMPFDLITRAVERSVRNLSRALAASGAEAFVATPPSK